MVRDWLKPPRGLLLILLLPTVVSVCALACLGWRLNSQERIVEEQRARERLEQAADRIAANFRRGLATEGGLQGLTLTITRDGLAVAPPGRLLYYSYTATEGEAPERAFQEGELHEFRDQQPALALAFYQRIAQDQDAGLRAGALLRWARVLRGMGRKEQSLAVYQRLGSVAGARVAGAPADLVARHEIAVLRGDRQEAENLLADLRDARWPLRRGQFEFYWEDVSRLAGRQESPDPVRVAFAEAAVTARGLAAGIRGPAQVIRAAGIPILLIRHGSAAHRTVTMTTVDSVLQQICGGEDVQCAALDADGTMLGGRRDGVTRAAMRGAGEFHLPWTLAVIAHPDSGAELLARQRVLLIGFAMMAILLLSSTYVTVRAIRRELNVSRLQSEFVSSVSHEFRTPLTSMRQLSEILAAGRVPNEDRRRLYYRTLVAETKRLERLVETLLRFGRMQAEAHKYEFEEMDAGELAEETAAAFERELGIAPRIERSGNGGCWIRGDSDALAVALRNLLDNAVKYSPPDAPIRVEWSRANGRITIQVRDRGVGIPSGEQKAIFEKFVRGSSAAAMNVKGTGVGLAMVKQIVTAQGGEIRLESQPGSGSTFSISLPAVEQA